MGRNRNIMILFGAFIMAAGLMSCQQLHLQDRITSSISKKYAVENFYLDASVPKGSVRRVILVPPEDYSGSAKGDLSRDIYKSFYDHLQKSKKFDVVRSDDVLSREQKETIGKMHIEKDGSYDSDALYGICSSVNAQAVIFTTITQVSAVKPFVLGVKMNMVYTETGKIIWAVDEVFDASRDDTKNLARYYYYEKKDTSHNPSLGWEIILTSFSEYTGFYFTSIIETYSL
jgi:hypothetical protein